MRSYLYFVVKIFEDEDEDEDDLGQLTPAFCFSPVRGCINFAPWFNPGTCRCCSGRVSWPDL